MKKIDWARKLSSRKFWVAVVNFITNLLIAFNVTDNQIAQVTALILAAGGLVAYIVAEGWIDASSAKNEAIYELEPIEMIAHFDDK